MSAKQRIGFWSGILLGGFLTLPPVADAMESGLLRHALLQIPLLVVAGSLLAAGLPDSLVVGLRRYNGHGAPGTVLAVTLILFWMLPRSLDAALIRTEIEVAKFLTVTGAGFLLKISWPRLGFVGKSFLLLNATSMLAAVGWLYRVAPVRLCNAYLIDDQATLGTAYFFLSTVIFGGILWRVWGGGQPSHCASKHASPTRSAVNELEQTKLWT